jgi:uncharacterized protein YuzE
MAKQPISPAVIEDIFEATPYLVRLPSRKIHLDYDEEADVLYISFDRPQRATDSEMLDRGILLRYRDEKLVGMTVFEASKR